MQTKSYVLLTSGDVILYRVQAQSEEHARVKLEALYGDAYQPNMRVCSYADWKADNDLALECIGLAPWQKKLNREERRNKNPLI